MKGTRFYVSSKDFYLPALAAMAAVLLALLLMAPATLDAEGSIFAAGHARTAMTQGNREGIGK